MLVADELGIGLTDQRALRIFNLADPAKPAVLQDFPELGDTAAMTYHNGFVYAVSWTDCRFGGCSGSGTAIVSLENPAAPALISYDTTRRPFALAAAGDVLYTAEDTGLYILSLADPRAPVEIGRLEEFADGRGISLSVIEPWLFVTTSDSLHIYDITTPEQPQKRAVIDMIYAQVTSAGPHFYAANGIELRLLDLSDPLHPRGAGGFSPMIGMFPYLGPVAAAGNYVYSASNGLFVFQRTQVELPNSVHLPLAARQ